MDSLLPPSDEFSEDFTGLLLNPEGSDTENFAPVETAELPAYTPLAEFNLDPHTVNIDDVPRDKFNPRSFPDRLALIRRYVGMIAGEDAESVIDEFLANGVGEDGKVVPEVTRLTLGTLATGELIIIATDTSPEMMSNPNRDKSVNPAAQSESPGLLTGAELDRALTRSGRGFMLIAALSVDGVVHLTKARDHMGRVYGKFLWALLSDPKAGAINAAA